MRRYVPLLFSTVTTWGRETRQDVRIHLSERSSISTRFQRHYLLSLEERLGVHFSAVDSDRDLQET
jgi:hypothetical protein